LPKNTIKHHSQNFIDIRFLTYLDPLHLAGYMQSWTATLFTRHEHRWPHQPQHV